MNRLNGIPALVLFATLLLAGASRADDEALKKDLTSVIALQGLPCGEVVAVRVRGDSDYDASCKDGNEYRVQLNAAGRVVVERSK